MRKAMMLTGVFLTSVSVLWACTKKEDPLEYSSLSEETEAAAGLEETVENPSFANFKAATINGEEADQGLFADYDLTMINIWATFCGPCLDEMPDLGEIHEEYKDKKFQVVGIVTDVVNRDGTLSESQVQSALDIIKTTDANYTHLVPSYDLQMAKLKDVMAVPTTVFVDSEGNLVGEDHLGARSKDDWIKLIDEYLKEVKE